MSRVRVATAFRIVAITVFGLSVVTILGFGSRLTFWGDEWSFLLRQPLTPIDYLRPNNEHWATVLYGVYAVLLGLGASTPTIGIAAETDPVGMSRRAPADAVSALDRRTGWRSRRDGHVRPP